ncbi:hypothetical protein R2601_20851 [Salipiger bermudensis HTCC2601]|uniref:SH3b domain-containing protein n=2 Tax=Salipiger TaxID=263377 RepID=Q0FT69_SALBH|nr:hypothetical protein R2601_20851 [Salipiger bermudensis HTCC2601]
MACPAPLSEQEARLLELLGGEVVVEPEGDGFRLLGGGVTATLVAQEPAPDLGEASYVIVTGVDAALNIRAEPGTQSGVRARASLGRVMQSEGCEDRPDRLWCRVRFLDSSGTEGWAAADYLTVATAMRRAAAELFDEIGRLDCQPFGGAADRCEFGVARDAGVTGAMLVYLPDNHRLLLSYDGSDLSVSDGESEVAADVTPSGDGLRVATDLAVLSVPLAPFARR